MFTSSTSTLSIQITSAFSKTEKLECRNTKQYALSYHFSPCKPLYSFNPRPITLLQLHIFKLMNVPHSKHSKETSTLINPFVTYYSAIKTISFTCISIHLILFFSEILLQTSSSTYVRIAILDELSSFHN